MFKPWEKKNSVFPMKDGGLHPRYHFRYRHQAVALTQPDESECASL
jgi:hypothetical protein